MLNDLVIFAFSLWGIIALMYTVIFKINLWRINSFTFTLTLSDCDKQIMEKIYNIRSFCEFCGIQKRSTVVIVNYGAPQWFCNEILRFYEKYNFVKIVTPTNLSNEIKELHT